MTLTFVFDRAPSTVLIGGKSVTHATGSLIGVTDATGSLIGVTHAAGSLSKPIKDDASTPHKMVSTILAVTRLLFFEGLSERGLNELELEFLDAYSHLFVGDRPFVRNA